MNTNTSLISMVGEEWKDVVGWEGVYCVSNYGRVKSLGRIVEGGRSRKQKVKEVIKKQWLLNGYPAVTLNRGKYKTNITCHLLVAKAFIPNPLNKAHVNHIDLNKLNPNVSNLEWCTPSENVLHAIKNGRVRIGVNKVNSKLSVSDVMFIVNSNETSGVLSSKFNIAKSSIKAIRNGRSYTNITGKKLFINPYKNYNFKCLENNSFSIEHEYFSILKDYIEGETWMWVPTYELSYEISNFGRIRSYCKSRHRRVLKQKVNKYGYLQVCLMVNNVKRHVTVHVLMAETYLNKKQVDFVNHINGNKKDNRLVNLELCDNNYNIYHAKKLKQLKNGQ